MQYREIAKPQKLHLGLYTCQLTCSALKLLTVPLDLLRSANWRKPLLSNKNISMAFYCARPVFKRVMNLSCLKRAKTLETPIKMLIAVYFDTSDIKYALICI